VAVTRIIRTFLSMNDPGAPTMLTEEVLDHRWGVRYGALTVVLAASLLWAFVTVNNFYPIPVWSLFSDPVGLNAPTDYYVLVGEFADGTSRPIPAIELSDALTGRIHMMVDYVMTNSELDVRSPHPANVALVAAAGGRARIPDGVRVPELLRAWGSIYNRHHPRQPVAAIRLEQRRWKGQDYTDYAIPVRQWREVVAP
jgi:hypothetical protein